MRRLLCWLGFHAFVGTPIPHTYSCRYCLRITAGHP